MLDLPLKLAVDERSKLFGPFPIVKGKKALKYRQARPVS
jgi:hypothetical protein